MSCLTQAHHFPSLPSSSCFPRPNQAKSRDQKTLNNTDKATFTFQLTCRHPLQKLQRNEHSWLTPEHQFRRTGDSAEIQDPTSVVTANGKEQTNEEAQENVHDVDLFVTVQILDDAPAILAPGKLCEEHGYTDEWASGVKTHLTKQGQKILCKTDNSVPLVVPRSSSNSGTSSSSGSLPQDSSSTSSSPATERSDDHRAPGNWRHSPKLPIEASRWTHDERRSAMRMSQQDLPDKSGHVIIRSELRIETGFPQISCKE